MNWRRHIQPYLLYIAALAGMVVLSLAVAAYITVHQRLRFPWQQEMHLYAEFENAQAVTAGQGQTVDVAGVKVGEIGSVKVEDGRAVVRLDVTEEDEVGAIYSNAKLFLRPKTGLNDMAVQMDPGKPDPALPGRGRLEDGDRIPIENTQANVNPDAVLAALDTDTRRYLQVLLNAGGAGLRGRSADLRAILKASQPTLGHARRVSAEVADRRAKVKRLIHNLRLLSAAAADRDDDLRSLTSAAAAVLRTLGERDVELQDSLERLPGALAATRDALPVVRDDLRPLVRETAPLLDKLRPSVERIEAVTAPDLIEVGKILNRTVNTLGFNPEGKEEGFLFHLGWYVHNATSVVSLGDAHGVSWRGLVMGSCSSFPDVIGANPALQPLSQLPICGFSAGGGGSPVPALPKSFTAKQLVERAKAPRGGPGVR